MCREHKDGSSTKTEGEKKLFPLEFKHENVIQFCEEVDSLNFFFFLSNKNILVSFL